MRSNPVRVILLSSIVLLFGLLTSNDVFSQATGVNGAGFPQHQTLDQQTIFVAFTQPLGGTTSTGQWTVRVDPDGAGAAPAVIVPVLGVATLSTGPFGPTASPTSNQVHVKFDATGVTGHGASIPYLLPGERLTIQFVNGGSTLITSMASPVVADRGLPVPAFGPLTSLNNYVPPGGAGATGSVDVKTSSSGPTGTIDQCAPVNTDFFRWTYKYSLRFRNSSNWVTADQKLNVTWNPGATQITGYTSDNSGTPLTAFTENATWDGLGTPYTYVTFRPGYNATTHVVDLTNGGFSYPDATTGICNFLASGYPSGVTAAAAYNSSTVPLLQLSTQFNSYDFDDQNTATLVLNPTVLNSDQVCLGVNVGMTFTDASIFNCVGNGTSLTVPGQGAVNAPINNQQRWVRFIYGSIDSPTPESNIRDARVGGVQVIDNNAGAPGPAVGKLVNGPVGQQPLSANPLLAGALNPTKRGYVVTGAGGPGITGVPDANGVIELPANATVASLVSSTITTLSTANHAVGQRFYVTLQYWGVCNPYYTVGPLASAPVEITVDFIQIIAKPTVAVATNKDFCIGESMSTTPAGPAPPATCATCFEVTAASITGNTEVKWYTTLANATGDASPITNDYGIQSRFLRPIEIATIASGGTGPVPDTGPTTGDTYSVWVRYRTGIAPNNCLSDPIEVRIRKREQLAVPGAITNTDGTTFPVCAGTSSIDFQVPAPAGSQTIGGTAQYVWSVTAGTSTINGSANNQTVVIDVPAGASGTQTLSVVRQYTTNDAAGNRCVTTATTFNFDVDATTVGGTVSGTKTICAGQNAGLITLSGNTGAIVRWEVNGVLDATLGTANPITPILNSSGTYVYQAFVKNGACATVGSTANATITVSDVPAKPTITPTPAATVCEGTTITLTASNVTTGTYAFYKELAPTWAPNNSATPLQVWLKADVGVTVAGAAVTQWDDQSATGGSQNVTPIAVANRPTRLSAAQNGLDVISFDGTDDGLRNTALGNPGSMTIFTVARSGSAAQTGVLVDVSDNTTQTDRRYVQTLNASNYRSRLVNNASTIFNASTAFTNTTNYHIFYGDHSTNASTEGSIDGVPFFMTAASGTLRNANNFILGRSMASSNNFNGQIAEVIIYTGVVTLADRQKVEGYLAHKWGLTANLPGSHPYKTTPPLNTTLVQNTASTTLTGLNTVAQSGNYRVQAIGPAPAGCVSEPSNQTTITINTRPTVVLSGGGSVCSGTPAPDVKFTFTGVGPYDLVYSIGGVNQPAVLGTTSPYLISSPAPGVYAVVSISDSNTPACAVVAPNGNITGSASVNVSATPPPTVETFVASNATCDDGGATVTPTAILNLLPDQIETYEIGYKLKNLNTLAETIVAPANFTSTAAGVVTISPTYAQLGGAPEPLGYQIIVTSIFNTVSLCAGAVPINGPTLIVNPRPAAPTGPVQGIACASAATGAAISVTAPVVGFTIVWSSTAAPTFTAAVGVTGGTRGNTFTPTSTATQNYFAFTRSDVGPSFCLSATSLSVPHIQDAVPTASNAGSNANNCTGTFLLAGNAPNTGIGELGTWTVPGIAYQQAFTSFTTEASSPAVNGWTRDVSAANVFSGGQGYFRVNGNLFELNNADGAAVGGAEVVWFSPVVNGAFTSLNLSLNLTSSNTHEAGDYLHVYYKLSGGAETLLAGGNQNGNVTGTVNATATGLAGTSIQLVIRANNNAADEFYRFDDILIAESAASTPIITNPNDRTATVSNLPVGGSLLTWTISSLYGVCAPSATSITLTRNPLPVVVSPTSTLCEDTFGTGFVNNINLNVHSNTITGLPGTYVVNGTSFESIGGGQDDRRISWFTTSLRNVAVPNPSDVDGVVNAAKLFYRVTIVSTGCTADGDITFTINSKPVANAPSYTFCPDSPPGFGAASTTANINLTTAIPVTDILGAGPPANRQLTYHPTLADAQANTGAITTVALTANINIFARVRNTITNCVNTSTIPLVFQTRASNNQITDALNNVLVNGLAGSPPFSNSTTLCASTSLVLLQINPAINPGATYSWSIPPVSYTIPANFYGPGNPSVATPEFELLTGTTGFFVILKFANSTSTPPTGFTSNFSGGIPIVVTETLGTSCSGNPLTLLVNVTASPPQPIVSGPLEVCENGTATYTITSGAATTHTWSIPAGATITSSPTASSINVQLSTFDGQVSVTGASGAGCVSPASAALNIDVIPKPSFTFLMNPICSGDNVSSGLTLTASATPPLLASDVRYTWEVLSSNVIGANVGDGDFTNTATTISQVLTNTTGLPGTVIYRVTPIGPAATLCAGLAKNITVTVNPAPVITPLQTSQVCSGTAVNYKILLTPAGLPAVTKFQWAVPTMNPGVSGGLANPTAGGELQNNAIHISDVLTNTTNAPLIATYSVNPSNGTCTGPQVDVVIQVNPKPAIPNQTVPDICSGGVFTVAPVNATPTVATIVPASTTYTWTVLSISPTAGSVNATAQPIGQSSISQTLTNTTNIPQTVIYTVTPTSGAAGSCVGSTFTVTVVVNPKPVIPNQTTPDICSGGVFTVTPSNGNPTAATIVPAGTTYTWTVLSTSPTAGSVNATAQPVSQPSISQTLTNTTNIPQTVVYTVTPTSGAAGSCAGSTFNVTVIVDPKPVIPNQTVPDICSGGSFAVTPANGNPTAATIVPASTTYTWTVLSISPTAGSVNATAQAVGQPSISQTLTNSTNIPQTVVYTVTPTSGAAGSCVGSTFTVTVIVNPKPVIPNQTTPDICSGDVFTVSPANSNPTVATIVPAGTTYTWSVLSISPTAGSVNATAQAVGQPSISQTLTNSTNVQQTVIYTVTPTSGAAGTCAGSTFTVTVVVNPKPVIPNQTVPDICSGGTFTVTPVNATPTAATIVPAGTTYTWTVLSISPTAGSVNATAQPVGQTSISQALINTTNIPQTVVYTVTPTSGTTGTCVGSTFTVTVIVNPKPVIPNQTTPDICSGTAFTITPVNGNPTAATIVPANTTYTWTVFSITPTAGSVNATAQAIGQTSIGQTLTNSTNITQTVVYTVTPTSGASGSCVGSTFTVTVVVNPKPVIPNQTVPDICSGGVFTVAPVNGNPTVATIVPGGTTYTWTVLSISPTAGSVNATAQPVGQSSISQTLTNTTNIQQTVVYTVTPTSGAAGTCVGATFTVTVVVNPKPVIPNQTVPDICSGGNFSVTPANGNPTAATIVPGGTTYTWTVLSISPTAGSVNATAQAVGQPSISQTLTNTTNIPQTVVYTVTPTSGASGSCVGSTFTVTVIVNPKPVISNQTPPDICSGDTFTVTPINATPTAATIVPAGTTYTWTVLSISPTAGSVNATAQAIGQPSISQTLTNSTNIPQTVVYTVTPTSGAAGTCAGSTFTVTVVVNPKPVIFNRTTPDICSGDIFTVTPTNGNPTAATIVPAGTTYTWTVLSISPTAGSVNATAQAVGQPSISQALTNSTNIPQTVVYTVTPTSGAAGSCVGSTFTVTVVVNPKPVIPNQTTPDICSGDAFTVTPINATPTAATIVPAGTTYTWTVLSISPTAGSVNATAQAVGQPSISQTLTNSTSIQQTVVYTVTPTSGAAGTCVGSTFTVTVVVNPKPVISNQTVPDICSGGTFTVTPVNATPTAATIVPAGTTYTWTVLSISPTAGSVNATSQAVGQPSISQTLTNTTNIPQTVIYTVTPTSGASGTCVGSTFTVTVIVNPKPVIPNQTAPDICSGNTFTVTPANGNPTAATIVPASTTFTWTVLSISPTAGSVNATAQAVGQPSISQTLTNSTNIPQTVVYTVTPTSGAAGSCVGSTFTVTVIVNPKPVIPTQSATICSGAPFTVSPTNGNPTAATIVPASTSYTWTAPTISPTAGSLTGAVSQPVGQSSISQVLTNTTNVSQTATYTVTPTSGAAGSCPGSAFTVTVTVDPKPVIPTQSATICSGDAFTISPVNSNPTAATIVPGGTTYTWSIPVMTAGVTGGSGQAIGQPSISQVLFNSTNSLQTATYTVTPRSGVSGTCIGADFTVIVTVNAEPTAPATTIIQRCSGDVVNFDAQTLISNSPTPVLSKFKYTVAVEPGPAASEVNAFGLDRLVASQDPIGEFDVFTHLAIASTADAVVVYTITPISVSDNCFGTPFKVRVIVHAQPRGQAFSESLCTAPVTGSALNHNLASQIANSVTSKFIYTFIPDPSNPTVVPTTAPPYNRTVASIANITDNFLNMTGASATVTYLVTPITNDANNCSGQQFTYQVTINTNPVGTPVTRPGECSNAPFSFDPQIQTAVTSTFTWTRTLATGLVVKTAGSGSGVIAETLLNRTSGNTILNAVYHVTPTAGACVGSPFDITIPIKPEPVVATGLDETKCSREIYGKDLATVTGGTASVPAATYDITAVKQAGLTGTPTTGTGLPFTAIKNDAFTNVTAAPLTVTYTVTPHASVANGGCAGEPKAITFTINPEPVLLVPAPPAICSSNLPNNPSTTGIVLGTNGTSVNASTYRIDQILYNGSAIAPAGFTFPAANKDVTDQGGINHIQGDVFSNVSLLPVTVQYTITPISSTGCLGVATPVSIVVNPEPILDPSLSPTAICSDFTIELSHPGFELKSAPSSVAATTFIIRSISAPGLVPGPLNEGIGSGKNKDAIDDDSYTNTTSAQVIVVYTIAPVTAAGCIGPDQIVSVPVNPAPAMKSGLDRIVCNTAVSNIVLQDNFPTTIAAVSYNIVSVKVGATSIAPGATVAGLTSDGTNSIVGNTGTAPGYINYIKNDKFVNSTNDRIIVTYEVKPISVANCVGPSAFITLTVEPQVSSVTVNGTPNICSGSPVNLALASPTYSNGDPANPVVTFSYTMVAVTGITGNTLGNNLSEGTVITDVLVNSTNNPITVNYKVTPRASAASNGAGCNGNAEDVFVIVQPRPKINLINNKTVCEGEPVNLSLISTTVPSTGSIKLFVTAVPSSGNITGFTNNLLIANNTVLADALVNSGSVTESVTYTIEPRNVDGANATICAGPSVDVIVTVSPKPVITPIADFSICSGEPFNPIPIVTDTENAIPGSTLVTWTVTPDATITGESNGAGNSFSQVLFNNSNDKKTVVYTINAKNISNSPACSGTPLTLNVTVYPVPKLVSLPSSINVCNNSTLTPNPFVLNSSVVSSLSPTFDWVVDDGTNPDLADLPNVTNGTSITQTFVNGGSFLGTYQYTITPHLTIPASGNPIAGNTCTGQDGIMVVNVAPAVSGEIYGFDITGAKATTLFMCKGSTEFIYIDPVGLPLMEVVYKEGSTTKTLTKLGGLNILKVSPTETTTYELISVKDKFGCVKTINQVVTVNVDAVSNEFSIVGPDISCSPFQVQFKHNQVAGVNYTWKWLDGPDSTTYQATSTVNGKIIKHTFANPSPSTSSKFKVSLEAFLDTTKYLAGCKKLPFVKEIKVYPTITTGVFPDNTVLCSGETVKFVNTSQGVSASGHKWFYRVQGSTQELDVRTTANVSYTLVNASSSNPIIYEVVYRSTNGNCPAEAVVTPITVYRGAAPGFNEGDIPPYIGGHSIVKFTNTTVPIDADDFRYEWEFGADGNPDAAKGIGPFTIDYTTPGEKDVILTVTNIGAETDGRTCVSEFRKTINILLLPLVADFKATPQAACFPSEITVTENTATGDLMEWKVVDSNGRVAATSNANLPVFQITNPGKYSIFLKSSSSFTGQVANTQQDNFEVYPVPVASFDARPALLFVPDTELNTFNFTTGATDYFWDFGDNGTSDEEEPKYKYKVEGVYDLTLIASNDHGDGIVCSDTLSRKITAKQGGVTKVPNAFTPNPNGSNGGVSTNGSFNDVFLPYVKGAEEFNMQIFDRWGNLIFESNNSTVGWDGYDRNGRLMQAGVYVYKLTLRLSDGQRTTQIGDITMIR